MKHQINRRHFLATVSATAILPLILLSLASSAVADHNWEHRNIVAGQSLYAANCASCHGATPEGQPNTVANGG